MKNVRFNLSLSAVLLGVAGTVASAFTFAPRTSAHEQTTGPVTPNCQIQNVVSGKRCDLAGGAVCQIVSHKTTPASNGVTIGFATGASTCNVALFTVAN